MHSRTFPNGTEQRHTYVGPAVRRRRRASAEMRNAVLELPGNETSEFIFDLFLYNHW